MKFFAKMNELNSRTMSVFNTIEEYSKELIMEYLIKYINFPMISSIFLP